MHLITSTDCPDLSQNVMIQNLRNFNCKYIIYFNCKIIFASITHYTTKEITNTLRNRKIPGVKKENIYSLRDATLKLYTYRTKHNNIKIHIIIKHTHILKPTRYLITYQYVQRKERVSVCNITSYLFSVKYMLHQCVTTAPRKSLIHYSRMTTIISLLTHK